MMGKRVLKNKSTDQKRPRRVNLPVRTVAEQQEAAMEPAGTLTQKSVEAPKPVATLAGSSCPEQVSSVEEAVSRNLQVDLPKEQTPMPSEKILEYLAFMISGEEYSVDIMTIKEIIRPIAITHVPRAPDYIRGIISLRGTIVPIIDVTKRLGLVRSDLVRSSRIVVISLGTSLVGFIVDSVTEVIRLDESRVEPPPSTLRDAQAEYIRGIGYFKDRMIIILDVEKTLGEHPSQMADKLKETYYVKSK